MILRDDKNRLITKLYKTLFYSIYLLHEHSKCFVQPVEQPAVQCKQTLIVILEGVGIRRATQY